MKVTQHQLDRVSGIFYTDRDRLPRISSQTSQMVLDLLAPDESVERDQFRDRIETVRQPFLAVVRAHDMSPTEMELLARLIVYGHESFLKAHSLLDEIEVETDEASTPAVFAPQIPVGPGPLIDPKQLPADVLKPFTDVEPRLLNLFGFYIKLNWDKRRVLEIICDYEPFASQRDRIVREWFQEKPNVLKVNATADGRCASVRANLKGRSELCEDDTLIHSFAVPEGETILIAAALDGASEHGSGINFSNFGKWLFNQLLTFRLQEGVVQLCEINNRFPFHLEAWKETIVAAIKRAQEDMKALLNRILPCLNLTGEERPVMEHHAGKLRKIKQIIAEQPDAVSHFKWYYLSHYAGASILELNVVSPSRETGVKCKIGDGQTLVFRKNGTREEIGSQSKDRYQKTNGIDVFNEEMLRVLLRVSSYSFQQGDTLLVTTDGGADNWRSLAPKVSGESASDWKARGLEELKRILDESESPSDATKRIGTELSTADLNKPDDIGIVVAR